MGLKKFFKRSKSPKKDKAVAEPSSSTTRLGEETPSQASTVAATQLATPEIGPSPKQEITASSTPAPAAGSQVVKEPKNPNETAVLSGPELIASKDAVEKATPSNAALAKSSDAVALKDDSAVDIEGTDLWSAAFSKACESLTPEQRNELKEGKGVKDLFQKLNSTDESQLSESPFRKGVRKLGHVLQKINFLAGLASPFASMDPTASTAFGLAQAVMTIAIGICGAEEEMTGQIQSLLERMPIIDRCDEIIRDGKPIASIYEVLVLIYQDLLKFFFEALKILRSSGFFFGLLKSQFRQPLSEIVSSFSNHEKTLFDLIDTETLAIVKSMQEEQINDTVWKLLDNNRTKEAEYHNTLKQRADEACTWMTAEASFRDWLKSTEKTNFLTMFGDMGTGKSTVAAYIVDYLSTCPELAGYPRPLVCSYYCRDDNETNKTRNIYASLLSQTLVRREQLKQQFVDWYKKTKARIQIDPTQSEDELRAFLLDVVASSSRRIYIVLDGMDECDDDARKHILELFKSMRESQAPSSVFLSSRHDDFIKSRMPSGTFETALHPAKDRDRIIVAHLVNRYLDGQSEEIRNLVVDDLAEKSEGSQIWVRTVLEYLQRTKISSKGRLKQELKGIPSPQGLNELYAKLFKQAADDIAENEQVIAQALEHLAFARRPLSLQELAYALSIEEGDEPFTTLAEVEDFVDLERIKTLISAFVTIVVIENPDDPEVRLVHQSLKELIVRASPDKWTTTSKRVPEPDLRRRHEDMNAIIMTRCVKYLLLDECDEKELFPKERLEEGEMDDAIDAFMGMSMGDDEDAADEEDNVASAAKQAKDFDPQREGLGGFFTYAAVYWTQHSKEVRPENLPQPHDLMELSRPGSLRLHNWLEHLRRPDRSLTPQDVYYYLDVNDFDALVVAARFGSDAMVKMFLQSDVDRSALVPTSAWAAVSNAISPADFRPLTAELIVRSPSLGPEICQVKYFYPIMNYWLEAYYYRTVAADEWTQFFKTLVNGTIPELLEWGNEVLCSAASKGCLLMIQQLFDAASTNAELKKNLLSTPDRDSGRQSIGEAAFFGKWDVVRYLLEQDGIDAHLRYQDPKTKRNTISWACGRNDDGEGVPQLLIKRDPDGADLEDESGWTPLFWALNPPGYPRNVSFLLESGHVDVNRRDWQGRTALSYAASYGNLRNAEILAEAKDVELNARCDDGMTPLSYAAYKGHVDIVRLLVGKPGVEIDGRDGKGRTPLSRAAQHGHVATVQLLLQTPGVEKEAKDSDGHSPLWYALQSGAEEVANLLEGS